MTPEERAKKREAVIAGMVAKGHTREKAEEVMGLINAALFGPGGRFTEPADRHSRPNEEGGAR